jgi:hypothetical protein
MYCGTREDEWDPDRGGRRNAYRAEWVHCEGCESRAWAQEELNETNRKGVRIELRRND